MASNTGKTIYGGPVKFTWENANSFGEFCYNRIKRQGDNVLLIDGITGEQITAAQILYKSIRVAECLLHYGIKAGDCVGICSENRFEVPYVMFAVFFIGATYAPFNPAYSERELLHASSLSLPKIIFASHATLDKVQRVRDENKFIKKVFVFGDEFISKSYASFNVFVRNANVPSKEHFDCPPQNKMENIGIIFCSSGTTGLFPKAVQLTQNNIWFSLAFVILETEGNDCRLSVTPWTHVFGCFSLFRSGLHGTQIVSLPKFDEPVYLKCIEQFKVKTLIVVPPLMVLLAKSTILDNYDLSSLQYAVSSAAPLSKKITDTIQKRIPQLKIRQIYGMSESGTFLSQNNSYCKSGSVGVVRAGVSARVLNTETGEVLGPNVPGELVFKGDGIMKGYVRDIDATKACYDNEGWFHTGDIGYYDDDEEWFIVDRLKELIKYKGYQVPPAELEALILTHPNVKDVGVIGIPDESAGELPLAFVVRQGNCTEKEISDFVAARISHAKRLHGGVKFIDEIPKNPTGKILRRLLRDSIKQQKSKL
ncbi:4-coumarate--CoA ligase 1-like [Bradysia coprophila]|uniref:4-coumarate--CoA ligase 1-like n=1 Tax=Bradysia coprophila TaxID=38358 RepID=UPI00187DB681|nr:4-coumarate--CoA ligase 1-like [Bradysia coprophila]